MTQKYGVSRVLEPKHVLPTSAWRLDNARGIFPHEIRVSIKRIHIERTSFKEICLEANNNEQRIRRKIMDIVIRRGKLHNPVTDTGGLFYGEVAEIGSEYKNYKGFRPGDQVICNASMASVPAYIDKVLSIDMAYGQVDVEGYAVLYDEVPLIRKPENLPINLLLFTFDESGTLFRISSSAVGKRKFLIVGNNLLSNLLFGCAIRKVASEDAEVVCLLDKKSEEVVCGESIDELKEKVFTSVHYLDILKPLECLDEIQGDSLFDLSVNCADIPGAETINILATKSGGTVVFANLINNYNISLYITEAISRQLDIRCADGYLEAYDQFDIEIVKEMAPYIERATEAKTVITEENVYSAGLQAKLAELSGSTALFEDFICESHAMLNVLSEIMTVSKYDCNVLITGETGVGKEKVANLIHKNSNRKMQPFIKVNCASVSPSLIESEFFGYEDGSFTGAKSGGKKGYFELADNGALFLDEIGELQPDMQAKLLRVIQDGEFYRVGGTVPIKTNVRIISATNRELEESITEGVFRRDLYYRLNVVRIKVPPLRERNSDIPALVKHFLWKYSKKFDVQRTCDEDAVEYLRQCSWPGNIRELENVVQRLIISSKGSSITLIDVMKELHSEVFDGTSMLNDDSELEQTEELSLDVMVSNFERNIIKHACEKYGSTRKAAKAIGISQTQLVRKKKKYEI